jgi:hypothetical protein
MTLPASGQISLNEIHIEVGGTTGTACTLDDSDIRAINTAGDPGAGGAQDFADYHGASAVSIQWSGSDTIYTVANPAVLTGIRWNADGTWDETDNTGAWISGGDWLSDAPASTGSDFELMWVQISGNNLNTTPGTESTWIDTGSTLQMSYSGGGPTRTGVFDVTIRWDSDSGSETTKRLTITKEKLA